MNELLKQIRNTVRQHELIDPGDSVVVGFSGGPDSLCLLEGLRQLREELGIEAEPEDLRCAGMFHGRYAKEFHGSMFVDNEVIRLYVYQKPVNIKELSLQESEVEEVRWFDLEEVWNEIGYSRERICVPRDGLAILREFLDV